MSEDKDIAAAISQLNELPLSRSQRSGAVDLLRQIVANKTPDQTDGLLAALLELVGISGTSPTSTRLSLFADSDEPEINDAVIRLYRLLDRLLRHLELLAGEARDTRQFRRQLSDSNNNPQTEAVLDELEAFLIKADKELTSSRDADMRALAFAQHQCEDLIEQAAFIEQLIDDLVQRDDGPVEETSYEETDSEGNRSPAAIIDRELDRLSDRLRITERKLHELHSGVRNRIDLSFKDDVTGAYRTEGFTVRLSELHARWFRARSPLGMVIVDVGIAGDKQLSPLAQDELMRLCSQEIESRIRVSDVMAATGPREFSLLLPDTNVDGANAFASRLVVALESAGFNQFGNEIRISVAAGIAAAKEGDDPNGFLARGRLALEAARANNTPTHVEM